MFKITLLIKIGQQDFELSIKFHELCTQHVIVAGYTYSVTHFKNEIWTCFYLPTTRCQGHALNSCTLHTFGLFTMSCRHGIVLRRWK